MKTNEIAAKKDKDLIKEFASLNDKLTKLKFEISARESNKTADVKKIKADMARIKTILREREIQREEEAANEKKA